MPVACVRKRVAAATAVVDGIEDRPSLTYLTDLELRVEKVDPVARFNGWRELIEHKKKTHRVRQEPGGDESSPRRSCRFSGKK